MALHIDELTPVISVKLMEGDLEFVENFVKYGPIHGGRDVATRHLLSVALRDVAPERLADVAGISVNVAQYLKHWLDTAGTGK